MRTGETVTDLGLYSSECCSEEQVFDMGDVFPMCLRCGLYCQWELEEEIEPLDEPAGLDGAAA